MVLAVVQVPEEAPEAAEAELEGAAALVEGAEGEELV